MDDSEIIRDLKSRRVLHYQPTLELSPRSRNKHYVDMAANTAHFRADRTLKKCNETIAKLEEMQEKNKHVRNASAQIEEMMRTMRGI